MPDNIFDYLGPFLEDDAETNDLPPALPVEVRVKTAPAETILCVDRADMGQDGVMSLLGGTYTLSDNGLTTLRNSEEDFEPSLIISDFSGSADAMGGTTTHLIVQSTTASKVNIGPVAGASRIYTVYDLPVAPIESAKATYGTFIEDYEEGFSSELNMLDVYGTMFSLTPDTLNSAAQRGGPPLPTHPGTDWDSKEKDDLINYFKDYAISNPPAAANYENVIFPHNNIVAANAATKLARDSFPFFIGFDLHLGDSGDVCQNLIDTKYADKFTANIAATIDNGDIFDRRSFVQKSTDGLLAIEPRMYDANPLATYDASSFIPNSVVIGNEADLKEAFPESQPTFNDVLEALKYLMDMRSVSSTNALNAIDISLGKSCYSETIVYRIAKFSEDDTTTPIQNFFLFNSPDASIFNFMDSQVIPGKTYTYRVYSYSFVASSVYEYTSKDSQETYDLLTVSTKPASKIVENMIFETSALVTSLPPVAPQTELRSFIGVENRIQILFQDSIQRITQQPVTLSQEEERLAENLRNAQGLLPGAPLTFYNDDDTKVYEIYRTATPPQNVNSFEDALWRRITARSTIDAVMPDKTYYYMFRTIDNHGNISNPSSPLEVTLVGGMSPYLLVNDYEYPSVADALRSSDKKFKRFLRLRPALQQLMLSQDSNLEGKKSSLNVKKVNAGVATKGQIWGKKYKIRIISKETGKKIDFNIKYDYNFDYREQ